MENTILEKLTNEKKTEEYLDKVNNSIKEINEEKNNKINNFPCKKCKSKIIKNTIKSFF